MKTFFACCVTLFLAAFAVLPAYGQQDVADHGATESDYGWWRDARFGVFIHWGPGAFTKHYGEESEDKGDTIDKSKRWRYSLITKTNGQLPTIVAFDLF
jgi:hypothetical protein